MSNANINVAEELEKLKSQIRILTMTRNERKNEKGVEADTFYRVLVVHRSDPSKEAEAWAEAEAGTQEEAVYNAVAKAMSIGAPPGPMQHAKIVSEKDNTISELRAKDAAQAKLIEELTAKAQAASAAAAKVESKNTK